MKIQYKMAISFGALSLLIIFALGYFNIRNDVLMVRGQVMMEMEQTADFLHQSLMTLENTIEIENQTSVFSYMRGIAETLTLKIGNLYSQYQRGEISYVQLNQLVEDAVLSTRIGDSGYTFTMSSAGVLVHHPTSPGKDLSDRAHIKEMMGSRDGSIQYTASTTGQSKIVVYRYFAPLDLIIAPGVNLEELAFLYDEKRQLLLKQEFQNTISEIRLGRSGVALITDSDGRLLYQPNMDNPFTGTVISSIINASLSETEIWVTGEYPGKDDTYLTMTHVDQQSGKVIIIAYAEKELTEFIKKELLLILPLLLIIQIIILLASIILTKIMIRPVKEVGEQLSYICEGDSDLTVRIKVTSNDEAGDLARTFNRFMETLHEDVFNIQNSAQRFSSFAMDISSSSNNLSKESLTQARQMSSTMIQIDKFSRNLDSIHENLEIQNNMIQDSNTRFTDLMKETEQVSEEMDDLRQTIKNSVISLDGGSEKLQQTRTKAEDLNTSIKEITGRINQVKDNSDNIGKILQVIEDISERTNLLAMNATIEAVHAGNSGKGFAVVAGEIKKLAENTQKAVQQVRDMITEIQASVGKTHTSVSNGRNQSATMIKDMAETMEAFTSLRDGILTTDRLITSLQDIHSREKGVNENLQTSVAKISEMSAQVKNTLKEQLTGYKSIKEVIDNNVNRSEKYARSSQNLAELGTYLKVGENELLRVVAKYNINNDEIPDDRRSEPRNRILYNLEIFDKTKTKLIGYLGNISKHGLMMLALDEISAGEEIQLQIQPPFVFHNRSLFVKFSATVRWQEKRSDGNYRQTGLQITEMADDSKKRYFNLMDELTLFNNPDSLLSPLTEEDENQDTAPATDVVELD